MIWTPHTTVAAVIEHNGEFLMVEENDENTVVFNQPAGHLEPDETLQNAIIRETREETGYGFVPDTFIGIYKWHNPSNHVTYLRYCFGGYVAHHDPAQLLDEGIIAARWMKREELAEKNLQLRSPMVLHCIDDYLAGQHYPLAILNEL